MFINIDSYNIDKEIPIFSYIIEKTNRKMNVPAACVSYHLNKIIRNTLQWEIIIISKDDR